MASRDIQDLTPRMQCKIIAFEGALANAGLSHFKRCCTYRSQNEQNVLHMQGRKNLVEVNLARHCIGLPPIGPAQNKKVTWTTVSIHTKREAVDYYVNLNGKYCDDLKVDVDQDDIPDWKEFGKIAAACGLEWGGTWEKPDYPHVQWKD